MNDCTIDEWVLKSIREVGNDFHTCVLFIEEFLEEEKCLICVDQRGVITRLYNRIADRNTDKSDVVKQWWGTIQALWRVKYVKPRITKEMREHLENMVFDTDDYIWVEVANASIDKRIVSGDKDFGCNPNSQKNREDIRNYLRQHGIHAMLPREALQLLQKTQT